MTRKNILYGIAIVLGIALLAGAVFWFAATRQHDTPYSTESKGSGTSTTDSNKPPEPAKTYPVSVYFSKHPDSDDDPAKTFPVQRVSPDLGVATFVMTELIKGPSAAETVEGYFTTIGFREGPVACDGDFKLSIAEGVARLQFCKLFDHRGVVADGQADSEIKATLRQFDTVKRVVILNSRSNCEFDLSGEDLCLR